MNELTIPRSVLIEIVEKSIEAGRGTHRAMMQGASASVLNYDRDQLRDIARFAPGVDFGHFKVCYGCPVTQAGLRAGYGFWFTMPYDKLMHAHLEAPHQLASGWAVKVIDDLS